MLSPQSRQEFNRYSVNFILRKTEELVEYGVPAPRAFEAIGRMHGVDPDKVEHFYLQHKLKG